MTEAATERRPAAADPRLADPTVPTWPPPAPLSAEPGSEPFHPDEASLKELILTYLSDKKGRPK